MNSKLEGAISGLLAVTATVIAGSVVHRTFFEPTAASAAVASTTPVFLNSWKQGLPLGIEVGNSASPVKILVLADLECPACRNLHSTLQRVLKARPSRASVVYISFPLPQHRFALSAARGAECANSYGKFGGWIDAVYNGQDSLGLKSWGEYAHDAGIADTASITACVKNASPVRRVQDGIAFGNKINLAFTPTVIVNGWRFPNTPTEGELISAIDSLSIGRPLATVVAP